MKRFPNKTKAVDLAIWQNANYRYANNFGVVLSMEKGDYIVLTKDHPSIALENFENLLKDYSQMSYEHIASVARDSDPLDHWEEIRGMFSAIHGETLRFILTTKLPLEKFLRYELACRGYDENFKWIGFDGAEAEWLK